MRESVEAIKSIWLEVSNIALDSGEGETGVPIILQLKGDADPEQYLQFRSTVEFFKAMTEAMKDKRPIYAKLKPKDALLAVTELRIGFSAGLLRS